MQDVRAIERQSIRQKMSTIDKPPISRDPAGLIQQIKQRGPAPVHLWDPPCCGDINIRIAANGCWFHDGKLIRRQPMIKLFSSVLKKEGDEHFLVTPVEKLRIQVDDCPFLACLLDITGSGQQMQLQFTLNTDEQVIADQQHAIQVEIDTQTGEPHPTLEVRQGMKALINRNVFYQLAEIAELQEADGVAVSGVWSGGRFFELGIISGSK